VSVEGDVSVLLDLLRSHRVVTVLTSAKLRLGGCPERVGENSNDQPVVKQIS